MVLIHRWKLDKCVALMSTIAIAATFGTVSHAMHGAENLVYASTGTSADKVSESNEKSAPNNDNSGNSVAASSEKSDINTASSESVPSSAASADSSAGTVEKSGAGSVATDSEGVATQEKYPSTSAASSTFPEQEVSKPAAAENSSAAINTPTTITINNGDINSVASAESVASVAYKETGVPQQVIAVDAAIPQPRFSNSVKAQNFIEQVEDGAINGWYKYRILPSVTVAQAILESSWGESALSKDGHNYFGIKSGTNWNGRTISMPTTEYYDGRWVKIRDYFRAYNSANDSVEDHGAFLSDNSRYRNLVGNRDYESVANNLRADGYATDPGYPNKLINLVKEYQLTILDQVAFGGNNISEYIAQYDPYLSNAVANYGARITENLRNDGLYKDGPYYTGMTTQSVATVSARSINGRLVRVLRTAKTRKGNWVQVQLTSGVTWWMDQRGITQVSDATMFDTVSNQIDVNYGAFIHESNRNDGLYANGPYMTSASTFACATKTATSIDKEPVWVIGQEQTSRATWVHIRLQSGETWWMDQRGLSTYDAISNRKRLDENVVIVQDNRNDGLYATGPFHSDAQTIVPADKMAGQFNRQGALAIQQVDTCLATWVQVRLDDGSAWWMDVRGVKALDPITNEHVRSGYVLINQTKRNDGLYATGPYMTSAATYTPAWKTAQQYNNQRARILAVEQTSRGTWVHVEMSDGSTWWMDQLGVAPFVYDVIANKQVTNFAAKIVQDGRNDGLYQDGPYMTEDSTYLPAAKAASTLNNQQVQVIARETTSRATWVQIRLADGSTWWMDERGVLSFDAITQQRAEKFQATVNQAKRNDGLYQDAPYFTGVTTQLPAVKTAKKYDRQQVMVLKEATTDRATWVYVQFADGSCWWMDKRSIV